ncbi:MAG: division/cell wall cluster transcriptional repressor MraZ [Gammaproteobacteria bacterium]
MFRGISSVNLDDRGRLAIPTRYRQPLQGDYNGQLIVTIDTEARCLLLYPLAIWETIEAKLQDLPSFNPAARRIQRLLIGHATDLEIDAQGRILLPALLRDYAELKQTIVLIGQAKKFEIWDEQAWQHRREQWLAEDGNEGGEGAPEAMKSLSL